MKLFIQQNSLVPKVGLEPTHLSAADFESAASTNSATRAYVSGNLPLRLSPPRSPVGRIECLVSESCLWSGLHEKYLRMECFRLALLPSVPMGSSVIPLPPDRHNLSLGTSHPKTQSSRIFIQSWQGFEPCDSPLSS